MRKILRVVFAVVLGFVVGSVVNMGIIMVSGKIIPPPPGADVTTMEGLKASLHLFEAKHFLLPFLAHALGTVVGAFVAALLAPSRSGAPAYAVGVLFLLGGIANVFLLPGSAWFNTVDLIFAYLPAAWLGQTLSSIARRRCAGV
ncbi:MAG: hypothetical protein OEW90_01940 [Betaproteobacteria bacterium]|nr:hypothetical protein [Betaproteobacteria bacterium]